MVKVQQKSSATSCVTRVADIFLYSPCDLYSKMKMSSVLPVSVMTSTEVGLKQPDFQYLPALCRRGKSWVLRQVLSRWTSGEKKAELLRSDNHRGSKRFGYRHFQIGRHSSVVSGFD